MSVTAPINVDVESLGARIEVAVRQALAVPALDQVRAALNESGLVRARAVVLAAPDLVEAAQREYRAAHGAELLAKEVLDASLLEAEWAVDGRFATEGNKTYLRVSCDCDDLADCALCSGIGSTRKTMTADERAKYRSSEARKDPAVAAAESDLRRAAERTAAARDEVGIAEARFRAARADLDAAIAQINALALGLQARRA